MLFRFEYYNNKYLKPWLLREQPKSRDPSIMRVFTKLNMQEAKAVAKSITGMSSDLSYTQLINQSGNSPHSARSSIIKWALHLETITFTIVFLISYVFQ